MVRRLNTYVNEQIRREKRIKKKKREPENLRAQLKNKA